MKTRPTTLADYRSRFKGLTTDEGYAKGLAFKPLPTDVIITPYSKSGTTWMQQIVHTLRTRGDMAHDDISRVVPWIEVSADLGIDLEAEQRGHPRAFKSHLDWHKVPKGGRYIVSVRNPKDVLVSSFRFMEGWFFERGAISLEAYAADSFLNPSEGQSYWHHLLSWWPQRSRDDVLMLTYEQMKADLPQTVRRVASFIGIKLDAALFDITVRHASFDFMQAHKDRFDDHMMRARSELIGQLPPDSDSSKVRSGQVGSHKTELTTDLLQQLDQRWAQTIEPELGFKSYAELAQALAVD